MLDMATEVINLSFGEEIRRLRERANLSQEELAERLSVSRPYVSKLELGKVGRPGKKILTGLEAVLGLSRNRAHELIGAIPDSQADDPSVILQQIAALPTHEERMTEWGKLPESLRAAVTILMQDIVRDAAQRYSEEHP